MMIYSSKGFEFFVVFVVGFVCQFNLMDLNKVYLFDKELGFGFKYIDLKLCIMYFIFFQQIMKKKMKKESMVEEMWVLYVVLMCVKEKFILVGIVKDVIEKFR